MPTKVGQASRLFSSLSERFAQTWCTTRLSGGALGHRGRKTGSRRFEDRRDACATERAFTMVEVAIAIAIIGFALVAIIGIIPAGLNVQRENREETIINQDLSLWMDAIRSGAQGMDYLTNYVDAIEIAFQPYDDNGDLAGSGGVLRYTPTWTDDPGGLPLERGAYIVGLLTTPKYRPINGGGFMSNSVAAYVRAISGGAVEKPPQDNTTVQDGAFSYRLTSEVVPFFSSQADHFDYLAYLQSSTGNKSPALYSKSLANNVHDVRLLFEWPLRPPLDNNFNPPVPTRIGRGRQAFRDTIGGSITNEGGGYHFVQPGKFEKP